MRLASQPLSEAARLQRGGLVPSTNAVVRQLSSELLSRSGFEFKFHTPPRN